MIADAELQDTQPAGPQSATVTQPAAASCASDGDRQTGSVLCIGVYYEQRHVHLESRPFGGHEITPVVMKFITYFMTMVLLFMTTLDHFMTNIVKFYVLYKITPVVMKSRRQS